MRVHKNHLKNSLFPLIALAVITLHPAFMPDARSADFDVPTAYTTIQSAIDAAMSAVTPDGETHVIRVARNATPYYENLLIEPSSFSGTYRLRLQGGWASDFASINPDPAGTVIDGSSLGPVLTVKCQRASTELVFENFTVQNGRYTASSGGGGGCFISTAM